jgi:hypothetical protein
VELFLLEWFAITGTEELTLEAYGDYYLKNLSFKQAG